MKDTWRWRGEHSAPTDNRMATMRLLRRKLKAVAMTVVGHEQPIGMVAPCPLCPDSDQIAAPRQVALGAGSGLQRVRFGLSRA